MSFHTIHHLPLQDSLRLPFRQICVEHPRASIHILHGLAEHSGRYAQFAAALNRAGYNVYAHDHRGHGANISAHAPLGTFAARDGINAVISDTLALNLHIRQRHPGLPVVLYGHSMGGLIASNYALAHSATIDAAAIWNVNFGNQIDNSLALGILYIERMLKGSDVPSTVLPRLTFRAWNAAIKDPQTQFDWLSQDPAEVSAYIADPLCGFNASIGLWINIFQLMNKGPRRSAFSDIRKDLPINIVGGRLDPATNMGSATREFADRLRARGFSNLRTTIYDQNRHESLHELNREDVTKNFLRWLEDMLPKSTISR